ncbi:MAG: AtpZ/AtpI family protein [Pedobacter sp.]|uniref:AtpZ/AtpI family protein n=1 Tax=Pedobacter sp. TaxID=1411316 RepID=UPI00280A34C0|nr:AtpZ/AtpI family protein [Pedobacter sp.]MDQ8004597.1 AtpZ/AtpI family protein [Pedobacter sp.]
MLEEENNKPLNKRASNYIKYTGVAFQMLATIVVFTFIGYKIDEHYKNDNFIITAILGIVGVGASLYQVVRSLNKN